MRFKNETGDLHLYVVAGTTTVLLSFAIDKNKLDNANFMGFDISRLDSRGRVVHLNGSKHFNSLLNDATLTDPAVKFRSLVQSFFWYDYSAAPGQMYIYTVKPMFGTAMNYQAKFANSVVVTTEKLQDGKHSVYFNYGVTGSQLYATNKEFGNKPLKSLSGQVLQDALAFLGRELWSDGLLKFVKQSNGPSFKLCCAFYEFQYPDFLAALKATTITGAQLEIVYSGKSDQTEDKFYPGPEPRKLKHFGNVNAIANAGLTEFCHPRTKPSQPHNKFMILLENGVPKQTWLGSTNITPAGIFGQCNTGHWVVDDDVAMAYFTYWKGLPVDPAMSKQGKLSESIQRDEDLTALPNGTYPFFSPRDLPKIAGEKPQHLKNYAQLIDNANQMVCMVLPFNLDEVFKKVYQTDKNYLRFLIFEDMEEAAGVQSNDRDLQITAGAILGTEVENWAKEVNTTTTAEAGIRFVHNKFFIVDALSAAPIVVTGSANFSAASIQSNDENSLMIKGDKRVADIYLTEFNRLFIHFWPRYLKILHPDSTNIGFTKPLDESYSWYLDYFDEYKFGYKRKQMFTTMVV